MQAGSLPSGEQQREGWRMALGVEGVGQQTAGKGSANKRPAKGSAGKQLARGRPANGRQGARLEARARRWQAGWARLADGGWVRGWQAGRQGGQGWRMGLGLGAGRQSGQGWRMELGLGAGKLAGKLGGWGSGIIGVGIEFEREKGIPRVEFYSHHHGGRGGEVPGAENQSEAPTPGPMYSSE